jgi:hypothetical protein
MAPTGSVTEHMECVETDGLMPRRERLVWCEWFRRHGADPNDVPVDNRIERHPDTYRLVYEVYVRNEQGACYLNAERTDAVRKIQVFQLEGPPLPFPEFPSEGDTSCVD